GSLLTQTNVSPVVYGAPELDTFLWYRAREIRIQDLNGDNDPDLVVGLDAGLAVYFGAAGVTFQRGQFQSGPGVPVQNTLPGTDFSVSGFAFGDFDHDGLDDLAVACFADGCLSILTRDEGAFPFREAMKVRVPSAEFVAVGDIDGDGQPDLAGSGRTALWVALSGHQPRIRPSEPLQFVRPTLAHAVINEVMSSNQKTLVGSAGDRYPDWVELYNPLAVDLDLAGWKLELLKPGGTNESYTFPAGEVLRATNRKLVLCANTAGPDLPATGYRLPDTGGTLRLRAADGTVVDLVNYPAQRADISYARYADGVAAFTSTSMATPGSPNVYTGPIPPNLTFRGFDPEHFTADVPVRLYAEADDDAAVLGVSLVWRRVDVANDSWHRVLFYDDGRHSDSAPDDGVFAGLLEPGLPTGSAIQFYLEATDANNKTTYLPSSPDAAEDAGASDLYVLAFGTSRSPVEISEVVSDNNGVFRDEAMGTPDYVEIANVSTDPVLMDDYGLIDSGLEASKRFRFPAGTVLQPGQTLLVLCDGNPTQGPMHANFKISSGGDRIYLQQRTAASVYVTVDAVEVPALGPDQAYSRIGARGGWETLPATPKGPNLSDQKIRFRTQTGEAGPELVIVFQVIPGVRYTIESSISAAGPWSTVASAIGTEVAGTYAYPIQRTERGRFLRVRSN
ncbi:MAG TPA: lamin tail domain-containing protein, partial [Candidatus Saccharimonadales bacterium]|nr:lamin tail domain-containing protein [Candidatus Saccharimonadales bacterium]